MTNRVHTLVVDDEPEARAGLCTLLARDAEIVVVGQARDGREAVSAIERLVPDLVLLDVQMPGLNGFDVLAEVGPETIPALVFVTAFDQFALKAFEVHALDYLLKPFTDERFFEAIARAKSRLGERAAGEQGGRLLALLDEYLGSATARDVSRSSPTQPLERFFVRSGDEVSFVAVDDVDWLQADGYCTLLHCGDTSHLVRGNIGSLETRLDPTRFARIHRSAIVNLKRVRALKDWFHGDCLLILENGAELRVAKKHRKYVEALLERLP